MSASAHQQQDASSPARADAVRRDRDRFLAFAFCAADILIELDKKCRISYIAGATLALTGKSDAQLVGQPFAEMVAPVDRTLINELLGGLKAGMRIDPVRMRFIGRRGQAVPLMLFGYQLAEVGGAYYFALRLEPSVSDSEGQTVTLRRDTQTGLLDAESFAESASARVREAKKKGDELSFTVLRIGDLAELRNQLGRDDQESLLTTVGATLKAGSAGGDCAARLDESNYGLVHAAAFNANAMKAKLEDYLKSLDPSGKGVPIGIATVADAASVMGGTDDTRAVLYTLGRICETALEGDSEQGNTRIADLVRDTSERIVSFRRIIDQDAVQLAFQPIVELATKRTRHFEVLARFSKTIGVSPYHTISFAENVGLICDFDLTMCRRALAWLEERRKSAPDKRYTLAVNLSGRSVGNTAFLESLLALFHEHDPVRKLLAIELTESARIRDLTAANNFIQSLRKDGHEVALDDFGTGASALSYLHSLEVDIVKIAGEYVRGAVANQKYRATLKAMGSLCAELGIETVAEMVEDQTYLPMLKECGIPLAQGYYFGKPSFSIGDFETMRWH
jgi:EAL domain-containing protein (putative c-di-GMP-specific phosphodiesterase class I)